ncbi:MAG: endolytic transglycosylase MltG [Eubacterium sp.]|nr:endolytic transglycosylase MltG [Eubacterium sp.]
MKFKYYLRGIGIGILCATLICMVGISVNGGLLTDENAIKRAEELGYTAPESSDATGNSSDGMTVEEYVASATGDSALTGSGSDTVTVTDSTAGADSDSDNTSSKSDSDSDSSDEDSDSNVTETTGGSSEEVARGNVSKATITIKGNDDSVDVADRLEDAGIVESASEFDAYLVSNGYDTKLSPGTYEVTSDMSFSEIVDALFN